MCIETILIKLSKHVRAESAMIFILTVNLEEYLMTCKNFMIIY